MVIDVSVEAPILDRITELVAEAILCAHCAMYVVYMVRAERIGLFASNTYHP